MNLLRVALAFSALLAVFLFFGCIQERTQYVCPDGTITYNSSLCPSATQMTATPTSTPSATTTPTVIPTTTPEITPAATPQPTVTPQPTPTPTSGLGVEDVKTAVRRVVLIYAPTAPSQWTQLNCPESGENSCIYQYDYTLNAFDAGNSCIYNNSRVAVGVLDFKGGLRPTMQELRDYMDPTRYGREIQNTTLTSLGGRTVAMDVSIAPPATVAFYCGNEYIIIGATNNWTMQHSKDYFTQLVYACRNLDGGE